MEELIIVINRAERLQRRLRQLTTASASLLMWQINPICEVLIYVVYITVFAAPVCIEIRRKKPRIKRYYVFQTLIHWRAISNFWTRATRYAIISAVPRERKLDLIRRVLNSSEAKWKMKDLGLFNDRNRYSYQ